MKTGIMLVGINGVNSSTLISGCTAMKLGEIQKQYGITSLSIFDNLRLLDVEDMIFSGWDYYSENQYNLLKDYRIVKTTITEALIEKLKSINPYKGIHTEKDIQLEERFNHYLKLDTISEAICALENDIEAFKNKFPVDNIIVIYLGSPSKKVQDSLKKISYEDFLNLEIDLVPSGLLYATAAIRKNAHFIDFTPSETLEFEFIYDLAEEFGVQLSGRDGSTGQTMMKLTLANMFAIRNLRIKSWYSTNILGNHDGYILSNPEYCETKIEDKKNGIAPLLGYDDFEHKITIDYLKTRFDSKESWDSIQFTGWLDTLMELKVNWQGEDAILSAPLLLDIIRLIDFGAKKGLYGFQKQLGLFYKHPFGCEGVSLENMYTNLTQYYTQLCLEKK